MNRKTSKILLGVCLLAVSAASSCAHYAVFKDMKNLLFYISLDIVFLPLQILLVSIILDSLISSRERGERLEKLNMVIGVFFSEAGTELLTYFSDIDSGAEEIKSKLKVSAKWSANDFKTIGGQLCSYGYNLNPSNIDFAFLKSFMAEKKGFLLGLMENPNLLEHETFTELLLAAFHLAEELANRKDIKQMPKEDQEHIANDAKRVYSLLAREWLSYMEHLKNHYPYLFVSAMRKNPFNETASVEIA